MSSVLADSQTPRGGHQFARCQMCATRAHCIVGRVSADTARALAAVVRERRFGKSDTLQTQGEATGTVAFIKLGMVMGTRRGLDGTEQPVALYGKGRLLNVCGLLGQANPLGARALSTGRLCEIRVDDLYRLGLMEQQHLGWVYALVAAAHSQLADWAHSMHVRSLPRQLLLTLHLIAREQGHQPVRLPSHVALAELLATTRESISRTLNLLEQQGALRRLDRWHCELVPYPLTNSVTSG